MKALFDYFIEFMQSMVTFFYDITADFGFPNYGIAIILFTVVIKSLLFPLTAKQMKSMKAMKEIGPQLKAVQDKYKNDKVAQQKAVAELYKESGINPLAGCLPLLFQMPILSGMFYALRSYKYLTHPGFLWIKNLSAVDHFYILPILAALTTYFSSRQSSMGSANDGNPASKAMLFVMPLFIGYMTFNFPAGLGLYWVVSNLMQIIQQRFLQKQAITIS
ncbi:MAG: rane protein insertase, YidC/Oxa1 family [Firmicutes bacterium]|nr:rane protein insertase, YidC/Oxa1 family [Bacillota bacterium]